MKVKHSFVGGNQDSVNFKIALEGKCEVVIFEKKFIIRQGCHILFY